MPARTRAQNATMLIVMSAYPHPLTCSVSYQCIIGTPSQRKGPQGKSTVASAGRENQGPTAGTDGTEVPDRAGRVGDTIFRCSRTGPAVRRYWCARVAR